MHKTHSEHSCKREGQITGRDCIKFVSDTHILTITDTVETENVLI